MKSPLSEMKERFGEKTKLVAAVEKLATEDLWLDRVSEAKGLSHVSNAKLLRLHAALSRAKQEFGTRGKLIGAILEATGRSKDAGYRQRLERYPLPRLLDAHGSASRLATRNKRSKEAAVKPATPAPKRPRSKKAKAKAASV